MTNDVSLQSDKELRAHLHGETSKLPWTELETHFARGVLFKVAKGTDILDVAIVMSRDDKDTLKEWLDNKTIIGVEIEDAKKWHETSASLWSVVVAPFILVQEIEQKLDS
ncbi:MAG: DUF2288 domain-containing protein [Gammaproteobacteria bacterium]|nr:DUF2288 domain-containing protein [Gammaproteobacteria bacterium]